MSAELQFKQLIDRILRCREAEDAAKDDTKEVYAELKALGYDKTAAGALVGELRKKDKDPEKFTERNATLDLYRDAYERAGASRAHTHTREANEQAAAKSAATVPAAEQSAGEGGRDRQHVPSRTTDEAMHGGQDQSAAALDHAHSPSAALTPEQLSAPEVAPPSASGATIPDHVPSFLIQKKTAADYRPNCLKPDACGASGLQHCYTCRKAMAESEAA